uniref:Uncharacterized protein n=1 Tax=Setaria digitata TaxID=48799 RepID=A0A915Q284_9BILA
MGARAVAVNKMLGSLRDALVTVHNELTSSVQKLRGSASPTLERCSSEAVAALLKTQAGSNLLLKYQLNIEMIEQMNDENIRLANLCSTRMGRAQQMCNERAEAILACHDHLRSLNKARKELEDLNNKINKLNRFCQQTELAMTYLEALVIVADTEAEITSMKDDLKKDKARINNFLEFINNVNANHSPLALSQDNQRLQKQFDLEKERLEEVALEEFLNCHESKD